MNLSKGDPVGSPNLSPCPHAEKPYPFADLYTMQLSLNKSDLPHQLCLDPFSGPTSSL